MFCMHFAASGITNNRRGNNDMASKEPPHDVGTSPSSYFPSSAVVVLIDIVGSTLLRLEADAKQQKLASHSKGEYECARTLRRAQLRC